MYYNDDPYYMSPKEEARLERDAEIEELEEELEAAERVIWGDTHGDSAHWTAVERAAEIRERLKALESSETQPGDPNV